MVKNPVSLDGILTHKYDDIIRKEYPPRNRDIRKHPPMSCQDRAKIFAPFAALKGYEEAVALQEKVVTSKVVLSEESKEQLDLQLGKIERLLEENKHPVVSVVYFVKDRLQDGEKGEYLCFTGVVAKVDEAERMLQIVERRFFFDDIYSIEGENLDDEML